MATTNATTAPRTPATATCSDTWRDAMALPPDEYCVCIILTTSRGPMTVWDLACEADMPPPRMEAALESLAAEGRVRRVDGGRYERVPVAVSPRPPVGSERDLAALLNAGDFELVDWIDGKLLYAVTREGRILGRFAIHDLV